MQSINILFIEKVNLLKAKFPCSTVSLDRTPLHNEQEGGAPHSYHLNTRPNGCQAIDLIFDEPTNLIPAAKYAQDLGFTGIELDFTNFHLHVDTRPGQPWSEIRTKSKTYTLDEYLTSNPIAL